MELGTDKKTLWNQNSNVKVRYFNGGLVEDMFYNLVPIMTKNPSKLILHACTNNTVSDPSKVVLKKITSLISYIKINNPACRIIIFPPVGSADTGKETFFTSNTFISNSRLKLPKIQANAKQHPETELFLFENYSHSSATLSNRNNRTYSKKKQNKKCVCIHEIIWLIIV